jgi:hypothetical protein
MYVSEGCVACSQPTNMVEIASYNFVAMKHGQDFRITRLIWHYGIDRNHSFASYHHMTRFNILPMVYAWAAGFPEGLCDKAAASMVHNYIWAWLLSQTGVEGITLQEKFINTWRNSEYDLMHFTDGQHKQVRTLVAQLAQRTFPDQLLDTVESKLHQVIFMRNRDKATNDFWESHGAKLVIAWVFASARSDMSKKSAEREQKLTVETAETGSAKATAEAVAMSVNENILRQVPWSSALLEGLLEPVNDSAREPYRIVKKDKDVNKPHGKPWMSVDRYIALLKDAKFVADMDGLVADIDGLTSSLEKMTMVGTQQADDTAMTG